MKGWLQNMREGLRQLRAVAQESLHEAREHPSILAAIIMLPLGFRWANHRWVER